ncbi:TetR/AcrR family transcriptional regulator [Lactococcus hircilactis]|uniref:TetR/AcrR family transcriptional regulator n=1 Tax=Lactococcus hircilactis TaxID=1494462 RepID=A0A7X1Z7Z6_9LACT|nr:TetR/AcrR family transcriptional regulator [Lactococcus hircilactis]MQW38402.1 TetR/AcrR family transcriptional regulator [Lactococcus hircilactis]
MSKDTKNIIIRTLFNIAAENGSLTVEEISKRSYITRTTIKSNFPDGIPGIVEFAYLKIVREVNERLLSYPCEEVSLDVLADILLPVLWAHKEEAHVIYSSQLPFRLIDSIRDETWHWAKNRFNALIKEHGLANYFTGKELLKYFNAQLVAVLTLWLEADIPVDLDLFRDKFLFLMKMSVRELIYSGIE